MLKSTKPKAAELSPQEEAKPQEPTVRVYRKDLGVRSVLESERALYLKSGWVLTSSRESLKDK